MASRTKSAELRFKPIAAGLKKLGLNPQAVLGSTWQKQINDLFSKTDRAAASALVKSTAPARYIAVIHPAGDAVANVEDQTAVIAPTLAALLAHFFNVSAEFCTGPDRVVFDPSEERIELYLRGRPLVTMQPLRFSKVSEQLMNQVDAVFSRPGGDGTESDRKYATYVKDTIARTTGLHNIGLDADFLDLEQPSADKWLRVGASLCRRLGGDAADLHLVQKITALALEVSCWDVIAKSAEDVALACGPWYMKSSDPAAEPVGIYASHRHAMAAFLEALMDNRFGTGRAPYLRLRCAGSQRPTTDLGAKPPPFPGLNAAVVAATRRRDRSVRCRRIHSAPGGAGGAPARVQVVCGHRGRIPRAAVSQRTHRLA